MSYIDSGKTKYMGRGQRYQRIRVRGDFWLTVVLCALALLPFLLIAGAIILVASTSALASGISCGGG
jgi:uncharacterized membrane protein